MHDASVANSPEAAPFCSVITAWSVERIERPNRSLQSPKIIAKFGRIPLAIWGRIDVSLTALGLSPFFGGSTVAAITATRMAQPVYKLWTIHRSWHQLPQEGCGCRPVIDQHDVAERVALDQ